MTYKKKLIGYFFLVFFLFAASLPVHAETTSIHRTGFSYANGHPESEIRTSGDIRAFCIEYGKHYANRVDDLRESAYGGKDLSEFTDTNFVGWGKWAYSSSSDHTLSMPTLERVSIIGAPSSRTPSETAGSIHSGAKSTYDVMVHTLTDGGIWNTSKRLAASVAAQYIDNERCLQVVIWAIANGKISAEARGDLIYVTFTEDCDDYIVSGLNDAGFDDGGNTDADEEEDLSGVTDNGFISTTRDFDTIRQYRRFVWIVTNWHQIPSFASETQYKAILEGNRIHLKWDDSLYDGAGGYTATVNDENGVLDWYDFTGCFGSDIDISQHGDGTLTISTRKRIEGNPVVNGLETVRNSMFPEDGMFPSVKFLRWDLEGTSETFTYTRLVQDTAAGGVMKHSIDYTPKCAWAWTCTSRHHEDWTGKDDAGCYSTTPYQGTLKCTTPEHSHASCTRDSNGNLQCGYSYEHTHAAWSSESSPGCYHTLYKKGALNCGKTQHKHDGGPEGQTGENGASNCTWKWTCTKTHYKTQTKTVRAKYKDWQDTALLGTSREIPYFKTGDDPYDPIFAYIAVVTDDDDYQAETDVEIKLIDQNGNETDHIRPGELYKVRYIYTYEGDSKGFYKKEEQTAFVPYYSYHYRVRMLEKPSIKDVKGSYRKGGTAVTTPVLDITKTNVTIKGIYTTLENGVKNGAEDNIYPNRTYKFSSGESWNDSLYLDALTTDDPTDGYTPLPAMAAEENGTGRSVQGSSLHADHVAVEKNNDKIKVTWTFDSSYEVFTSPIINAVAYIQVGESKNQVFTCFEEAYNYAENEDHLFAGDAGYFGRHVIYTKNARYETYALKNQVWQTDVEINTSNVVLNTGAGITQAIYSSPETASHRVNYNLYYTVEMENPKAHIYWNKLRQANNKPVVETEEEKELDIHNEIYEFDVNTLLSWKAEGAGLAPFAGQTATADHISTGKTYLQREIPTALTTLERGQAKMELSVYPNYDRLVYEGAYRKPVKNESEKKRTLLVAVSDSHYPANQKETESVIYPAINPVTNHPSAITGNSDYDTTTSFIIRMGDGVERKVYDRLTKDYTLYSYQFNTEAVDNRVTFPARRKSAVFFKYSSTSYPYNNKNVIGAARENTSPDRRQTEKYYISQILFKSNYTYNHNYGEDGDGWVDMVADNEHAVVAAGQGFELKVAVKYENSLLTQYLARYFGTDDGQNAEKGSSSLSNKTAQYCNISALTGGYINGYTAMDRFVTHLITGSNVYTDLYACMSDNPDSTYSAMGMYGTPVVFDREISYNDDYSVTTITYTMKKSKENGVASSFQTMKFYTNQLAPDSDSQGIIEDGMLDTGKHSILLWTPIIAATPFDYPDAMQDRYIGDAVEIGYTIRSTAADNSIVHIVQ